MDKEQEKLVARNMYDSLCAEFVEIAKKHVGERLGETEDIGRVNEIFQLVDLIKSEYDLDV